MALVEKFFEICDPEKWSGLARLLLFCLVVMIPLRGFLAPEMVVFPDEMGDMADWSSMVLMSAWLIAFDAMIMVMISYRTLKTTRDVMIVAAMVAGTHIVFPLLTFGVTAFVYWLAGLGYLPPIVAEGVLSAIYLAAFLFVFHHLLEVNEGIRDPEAQVFDPKEPLTTKAGRKAIWGGVVSVSIDALMVGPAKIAFLERYETWQFASSFVFIGLLVGVFVIGAGLFVIYLRRRREKARREKTDARDVAVSIQKADYRLSMSLWGIFVHFNIFALVYLVYTFYQRPLMLEWFIIWGATLILFALFWRFGRREEVYQASLVRAGLPT